MGFGSALLATFSFRVLPVTIFAFLLYATIFVTLEVTDQLAPAPSADKQHGMGLSLDEAYGDLHAITSRPHPYISRQNDQVRTYLLERLNDIARDHDFIHVLDDHTTSTHLDRLQAVYFQGNNVIVKVDGSEDYADGNAILFSAHFDSVSTSPGATDDGMSVVSLVQMVKYLSKNRPRRTFIANINNGEEDGLNGAHSYLAHPWANLTKTFVNFEGAGSGGRPFLFRANSLPILRAFTGGTVPHPHAYALSADAFAQGVIRSETDYAVYSGARKPSLTGELNAADHTGYRGAGGGMRGADVAFYQNRARYHTSEDSIRAMGREGTLRALWAMMEVARGAGSALLGASANALGEDVVGNAEPSTYFELFAAYLIAYPLRVLMAIFIVLLVVGPIVALILGFFMYRQTHTHNANVRWTTNFKGYGRFWLALLITIGLHVALVVGYLKLNPYTIHANSIAVVLSVLSLSYLAFTLSLSLAQYLRLVPPAKQKFAVLLELYLLTWALLVASTVVTGGLNVSGLYWVGAWNASAFIAVIWGMIESLAGKGHGGREIILPPPNSGNEEAAHSAPAPAHAEESAHRDHDDDDEATERTPLIGRWRRRKAAPAAVVADEKAQDRAVLWWILQMLFSIPVPAYLIGCIARLWVQSMAQTVPDGGWAGIIYIPLSLLSILLLLPLAPFVHKLPGKLNTLILIIFVASTAYAWLIWPFNTSDSRLKVFFQSTVHLANITDSTSNPSFQRAETQLTGVPGYVDRVVRELPSSWTHGAIYYGAARPGLMTHRWQVEPRYVPSVKGEWLNASAVRVNASTARFSISGSDTRACRIYFDNADVSAFRARSRGEKVWKELTVTDEGVRTIALWSRSWDDAFDVEVSFAGDLEKRQVQGRVACLWAEVDGVWAGEGKGGVRIPALEEVLAFMPEWAIVTKWDAGLVEAQSGFLL